MRGGLPCFRASPRDQLNINSIYTNTITKEEARSVLEQALVIALF